jgi:folylpolyglutamate synthase/dihydropteroate synthase
VRKKSLCFHFLESQYLIEKTEEYLASIGAESLALKEILPLPAYEFSLRNSALASAAFSKLMKKEFQPAEWRRVHPPLEHRGEIVQRDQQFVFFGSHNVDGMRKLIQFLHSGTYNFSRPPYDLVIVAFSRRNVGDLRLMLRMLKQAGLGKIVVTVFDHPKAEQAQLMADLSREEGSEFVQDINSYVQGQNKGQRLLVTGSYYFLGHFKSLPCCR